MLDEFGKESLKPGFFGGAAFSDLVNLLGQLMGGEAGMQLACTLTFGLTGDTTVAQNQLLYEVALDRVPLDRFLATYGHRAVGEMELAVPPGARTPPRCSRPSRPSASDPRYRVPAEYWVPAKHRVPASPRTSTMKTPRGGRRPKAICPASWPNGAAAVSARRSRRSRQAQSLLPYRESGKHYLMMGYELLRAVIVELAAAGTWAATCSSCTWTNCRLRRSDPDPEYRVPLRSQRGHCPPQDPLASLAASGHARRDRFPRPQRTGPSPPIRDPPWS